MPTAFTSGAANASAMIAFGSLLATARAVATIVAVVPTLDFKSQESLSLRVMLVDATAGENFGSSFTPPVLAALLRAG